jgi:ligand-binding sensor protein
MENFKIPLVLVAALAAQLVGAVFWGSNILRDISDNTARSEELIEILLETEEALEEVDEELWDEFDAVPRLMTDLIRLQARVAILEKTVEFSKKDGM